MKRLTLLVLLTAAGCLSPREITPVHRYLLQPAVSVQAVSTSPKTLGVRPLEIAASYDTTLAHADSSLHLAYWPNEEWAERPAVALTRLLQDAIGATKAFQDSGNAAVMARPDYYLTGTIRKFHARQMESGQVAEIEVLLEVREARGAARLWDALLHEEVPMDDFTPAALASAMNQALASVASKAANGLAEAAQSIPAAATPVPTIDPASQP
ncbi:MAG: membrane integrity-associated transporter subunit PqiC [Candidatus Hydrogenedentes bacterium]|nr:membrane integrity-associated transporter subunit PqiC [Candidatus Hydrogenedentota bacterium]